MDSTPLAEVVLKMETFIACYKANLGNDTDQARRQVQTRYNMLLASQRQFEEKQLEKHDNGLAF